MDVFALVEKKISSVSIKHDMWGKKKGTSTPSIMSNSIKMIIKDRHYNSLKIYAILFRNITFYIRAYEYYFILDLMASLLHPGFRSKAPLSTFIPERSKLMSITPSNLRLTIIDSFGFLPMPLSALPSYLRIPELKKGFFPFLFNTKENQFYVGPLPSR